MPPFSLKSAFVAVAALGSLACGRKQLDLIDERVVGVGQTGDAGKTSSAAEQSSESSTLEPLPSSNATSDDAGLGPTFPPPPPSTTTPGPSGPCPPNKPYFFNDACWECRLVGANQCGPGLECEPGPFVCKPLCDIDRDCIFREFSLPVCDDFYHFCRGCSTSFECSPGLTCSNFGQCVQSSQPPMASSAEDAGGSSMTTPSDAGPITTSDAPGAEPSLTER